MEFKELENLDCPLCHKTYNEYENIPRMLPDCGHTFCSSCLNQILLKLDKEGTFLCPEDKVPYIGNKRDIIYFPKNFALLRVLDKKKKDIPTFIDSNYKVNNISNLTYKPENRPPIYESKQFSGYEGNNKFNFDMQDYCKEHNKKLEIICIDHQQKICVNCALFGSHKNHNIKSEEEVLREITMRADKILEIFQEIENTSSNLFKQNISEEYLGLLYDNFIKKTERISNTINEKFSQLKNFVKELEKKILNEFLEAFQLLEGKLKILKKIPFLTFQNQVSSWKILSKEKLIALSEKTEMNQINFDLLENKENPEKDIVRVGQTILAQTRKISCLSLSLIKTSIDNIEVRFNDQEIQKKIEEIFCERNLKLSPELTKNNLTNDDLKSIENYFNKIKALQESSIAFNNNNKWEFSLTNDEVFKSRQSISKINEKLEGRKTIMNQEEKPLQKSNISSDFHIANSFINSLNFQELIKESNPKLDDSEFLLSGDILDNSMKLTQNPLINNQTKSKPPLKQNYAEDKERTKQLQIIEEKSEKAIGSFKAIGNNRTYLLVNKRSISKSPFRGNNSNVNTSLDKMNENEFKNMISPSKNISPFLNDSLNDISTEKKLNTNTSQKKLSGYLGFRINEKFQPIFNGLRTDVLEVVDFTCADLGDAGIGFLAESLSNTVSMKSLKLVKNKITDEGGMILCKALAQNFSLANLNLTLNHLSEKSIDTFYGLIKGNATLKNLYLLQNNISVIKYKFKVKDFKLLGTNLFL